MKNKTYSQISLKTWIFLFWLALGGPMVFAEEIKPAPQILWNYYESVADQLYNTKELPGNLRQALEYYKKASHYATPVANIDWKITRCYWVLATKSTNSQQRSHYFKEGIRYGKEAVKKDKTNSNAHSWLALVIGSSAMDQGVVKTLYNREKIKSGLETAIQLDPENTNAYVGLASWYYHVPAILGGDREKALQLIERAIDLEPEYTAPLLFKAEFLTSEQRFREAIETLKQLLATTNPVIRGDGIEDKIKAKKLLQTLQTSDHSS